MADKEGRGWSGQKVRHANYPINCRPSSWQAKLRVLNSTRAGKIPSFPSRHFIHSTLWLAVVVWLIRNFYFSILSQLFLFCPCRWLFGFHVLSTFFRFVCFVWVFLNFPLFYLLSFGEFYDYSWCCAAIVQLCSPQINFPLVNFNYTIIVYCRH